MPGATMNIFPEGLCAVLTATDDPSRYEEYKRALGPLGGNNILVPDSAYATAAGALKWILQQQPLEGGGGQLYVLLLDPPGIFPKQEGAGEFFRRLNEHNGAATSGATAADKLQDEGQHAGNSVIIPIIIDSDPKINNREFYEKQGALYLQANREAKLTAEQLLAAIATIHEYHFQKASELKGNPPLSEIHQQMAGPWKGASL